jgi:hypothetical protein
VTGRRHLALTAGATGCGSGEHERAPDSLLHHIQDGTRDHTGA